MLKLKLLISPEKWYYSIFVLLVIVFSAQIYVHYLNQATESFDFGILTLADEMWEELNKYEIRYKDKEGIINWTPGRLKSFHSSISREFKDESYDSNLKDMGFLRILNVSSDKILFESKGLKDSGLKFTDWVGEKWDYKPFKTISNGKELNGIGFLYVRLNNHVFIGTVFEDVNKDSLNKNLNKYRAVASIIKKVIIRSGSEIYVKFDKRRLDLLKEMNAWTYVYFYEKDKLIFSDDKKNRDKPFLPKKVYDKIHIATIKVENGDYYRQRSEFREHGINTEYRIDIGIPEKSVRAANKKMGLYITVGAIILIGLVGVGGHSLKKKAMLPVNEVINIVNEITSKNMDTQIPNIDVSDDISRLISTFNDLLHRLAVSFKLQKTFIANTSHELITPLSILSLDIDEVLKTVDDKSEFIDYLREAKREIAHITRIVSDLQWLAKNDAGQLHIEKTNIRLDEVLIESMSRCQALTSENNIQLIVDYLDIVEFYGDYSLLVQAYSNLISNAIKYSKKDGKVKVALTKKNYKILMSVEDEGLGIPEKSLPKIYDRFYRVDKSRSRETGGSGLGLAIVKHIVELHGGYIKVKSELNVGSTFVIELPTIQNL